MNRVNFMKQSQLIAVSILLALAGGLPAHAQTTVDPKASTQAKTAAEKAAEARKAAAV